MDMKVLGSKHLNDMPVSLTLLVPQPLIKSCVLDYKEFSNSTLFFSRPYGRAIGTVLRPSVCLSSSSVVCDVMYCG